MRVNSIFLLILCGCWLAGCAGTPLPPDWQTAAHGSLQGFSSTYLKGDTRAAELQFKRARSELASTGQPELVARAELVRCAVRAASLEFDDCPGFLALAQDASASDQSYAAYLAGRWQDVNAALLPPQHRLLVAAGAASDNNRLQRIDDPLSRLVAAGALLQSGHLAPADIMLATATASAQGWRRPLLAWLGVQLQRAQRANDPVAAARLQRRIALVETATK